MTIDRIKGNIVFICDDCDEALETETSDFEEAKQVAQEEGWTFAVVDGEFVHNCPDCKVTA